MKTKFYINDTLEKVIYSNESQFIYFGENLSLKHLRKNKFRCIAARFILIYTKRGIPNY